MTSDIRVLTLNCWGLKYISKNLDQRIQAIAEDLATSNYHIIAIQELWVFDSYELIRTKLSELLPFSKFFYSGVFGAGLALFSQFPILAASLHPYSLNGSPVDLLSGDWFVGKAAASIVISHPVLDRVDVYTTHMFAGNNMSHRLANAWEFSKLIRNSLALGRHVIAMGDFNSTPSDLANSVIREHTGLIDAWGSLHESNPPEPSTPPPTPSRAIDLFGVTCDSPLNSYTSSKRLANHAKEFQGKRIDYIFFLSPPSSPHLYSNNPFQLYCKSSGVTFTKKVPGSEFSFSDHFGVDATLGLRLHSRSSPQKLAVNQSSGTQIGPGLDDTTVTIMLQALVEGYRGSRSRARLQLFGTIALLVVLICLVVYSTLSPHPWCHPALLAVSVLLSSLATTLFYAGFIYGHWEINSLTTMIEELELYRHNNVTA